MIINSIGRFVKNILPYGLIKPIVEMKTYAREQSLSIPDSDEPDLYNKDGLKLRTFYLKDEMYRDQPYSFVTGRTPTYLNWDRYNYGLKNHFYTHRYIFETHGKPLRKFAFLIESESIVPHHYDKILKNPAAMEEFDAIFTHSESLLDKYSNALFMPGAGVWFGTKQGGGLISCNNLENKTKSISMVSSSKSLCELHDYRINLALYCKRNKIADTFGTFDGGSLIPVSESLTHYRFSLIIENNISKYWFTEKIMNCFAACTVPIYLGATAIDQYFNTAGIIRIEKMDFSYITGLLSECTEERYKSMKQAILDNFYRVQSFLSIEDFIYLNYSNLFI